MLNHYIKHSSLIFVITATAWCSSVQRDQDDRILAGLPVPRWVDEQTDDGSQAVWSIWRDSQMSYEATIFSGTVLYQLMRLNAIETPDANARRSDLITYYQSVWAALSLHDRLFFVITPPYSAKLWSKQPLHGQSPEAYVRDRAYLTGLVIQMMSELNSLYSDNKDVGPTRLIDIDMSLISRGLNAKTNPDTVHDENLRVRLRNAIQEIEQNTLKQYRLDVLENTKEIMDDALPAFIAEAYIEADEESVQLLSDSLKSAKLNYGRWTSLHRHENSNNQSP